MENEAQEGNLVFLRPPSHEGQGEAGLTQGQEEVFECQENWVLALAPPLHVV